LRANCSLGEDTPGIVGACRAKLYSVKLDRLNPDSENHTFGVPVAARSILAALPPNPRTAKAIKEVREMRTKFIVSALVIALAIGLGSNASGAATKATASAGCRVNVTWHKGQKLLDRDGHVIIDNTGRPAYGADSRYVRIRVSPPYFDAANWHTRNHGHRVCSVVKLSNGKTYRNVGLVSGGTYAHAVVYVGVRAVRK
jgi:hypothetical protein